MQDDDGDMSRLMRRFRRTELGAVDADDSDLELYAEGVCDGRVRLSSSARPQYRRVTLSIAQYISFSAQSCL